MLVTFVNSRKKLEEEQRIKLQQEAMIKEQQVKKEEEQKAAQLAYNYFEIWICINIYIL